MPLEFTDYNIVDFDSGTLKATAPNLLAAKLLSQLVDESDGEIELAEEDVRFLTNALVSFNLIRGFGSPDWAELLASNLKNSARRQEIQVQRKKNTSFMKLPGCVLISIDRGSALTDALLVLSELNDISYYSDSGQDWVIDLSQVHELPKVLIGYLIGFRESVVKAGGRVTLIWVHRSSVSDDSVPILERFFGIRKKGAFYVSHLPNDDGIA